MRVPTLRSRSLQRSAATRNTAASASPSTRTPASNIDVQIGAQNILSILGDFSNLGVNLLNQRMNIFGQDFSFRDLLNTTTLRLNAIRLQILAIIQTRFFNGSVITDDAMINVSFVLKFAICAY